MRNLNVFKRCFPRGAVTLLLDVSQPEQQQGSSAAFASCHDSPAALVLLGQEKCPARTRGWGRHWEQLIKYFRICPCGQTDTWNYPGEWELELHNSSCGESHPALSEPFPPEAPVALEGTIVPMQSP